MAVEKVAREARTADVKQRTRVQQRLAERAARREAERAERQNAQNPRPAPQAQQTQQPSTQQPTQQPQAAESAAPRKNFIGSLKGAKVVNIAVQGGRSSNPISVFASGEGPNAKKVDTRTESAAKPEQEQSPVSGTATQKVDTVV